MRVSAMAHKTAMKKASVEDMTLPIALVFSYDRRANVGKLRGISRYARGCDNWALVSVFPHRRLSEALSALKPAGIIVGNVPSPGIASILRRTGRPIVTTTVASIGPRIPRVTLDDVSIGIVAAKHLVECGLRNFGYFGPPWNGPDTGQEGGFRQTLQSLSHEVAVCYARPAGENPIGGTFVSQKDVRHWLAKLPKPAGVFAPNDIWALWLCGVCKQEGIKVPEDIAILGAGDDELMCELARPSLSSVAIPAERIGYEAAAMLDRLMNRDEVTDKSLLLPAIGVVTRQSTDVLAVTDPDLVNAINYMRSNISESIAVEDVLQHVHISRSSFEKKFHEALGRSPAQEIRRMRVAMAKTFLTGTGMKIESIAKQCGFSRRELFSRAFHQATGITPAEYRRAMGRENSQKNSSPKFPISHNQE
jgi:LacI family transcriptional regulator